jgi:uncharacterized protein YkwD
MLRPFLAAFLALGLLAGCESPQPAGGVPRISEADAAPIRLRHLDAVNAFRRSQGLGALELSAALNAAADTHARDMWVQNRAWHFGSDLTSPRERAFRAGYAGELAGENLSESADSDLTVLQTWLDFADTRGVVADPEARYLGLGWHQDPTGKLWWVQLIGR